MSRIEKIAGSVKDFSNAWLVKDKNTGAHYVVSGVDAMFTGWEVLVFLATEKGEVTNWCEVAGGRGISHDDAVAELENVVTTSSGAP